MSEMVLPRALAGKEVGPAYVHVYENELHDTVKCRVTSTHHAISFLFDGEKTVCFADETKQLAGQEAILFPAGNCLMTERRPQRGAYRSVVLFFDDTLLAGFLAKHASVSGSERASGFIFGQDPFILHFAASLRLLHNQPSEEALLFLKVEEILTYLTLRFSGSFPAFLHGIARRSAEGTFRRIVESNSFNRLSLDELAFLCHMSVSTFKRRFESVYGMGPSRWFHAQRMKQAAILLRHGSARPSDIHLELGYENLSSFIQAFKKEFGVTPRAYQGQD
ncbi:helix-turn-helix transcriptional regulator [Siphonobacter aquaeclarae]|nr:AraC family transcriptional regulator [Siphonobacter aquaeclarae]